MPMKYDKLFALLKEKGYSSYRLRKEKLVGQSILQKLRDGGDIDTRTIRRFCDMLNCQPGDIMEYIPDVENEALTARVYKAGPNGMIDTEERI